MREVPLTKGLIALVDDEDYERIIAFGKWHAGKRRNKVYAARSCKAKGKRWTVYLHRFVMNAPPEMEVDHEDRDTLNCQKGNLRACTRKRNAWNMGKMITNTSGYKGVRFYKGRWDARISTDEGVVSLGRFGTAAEAGQAYDLAAQRYHGAFAYRRPA